MAWKKDEKYYISSLNHLGAILVVALRLARTTRVSRDRRDVSSRTFLLIFVGDSNIQENYAFLGQEIGKCR